MSNMDVVGERDVDSKITGGKRKAVKFNKTPLMSTYLLAFIVGELKYVETKAFRLPVRVYATPDKDIEHGRFSVELAAKTLAFYEKEFDNEYPLPKMDMVAVPDFSAGVSLPGQSNCLASKANANARPLRQWRTGVW